MYCISGLYLEIYTGMAMRERNEGRNGRRREEGVRKSGLRLVELRKTLALDEQMGAFDRFYNWEKPHGRGGTRLEPIATIH